MDGKKIAFNFKKVSVKPQLIQNKQPQNESNVELIKSFEGQKIQLVNEIQAEPTLVIPMPTNQKTSAALESIRKRRAVLMDEDESEPPDVSDKYKCAALSSCESDSSVNNLEKRATHEIIAELQSNNNNKTTEKLVLPLKSTDGLPLDGAKPSSLDDYESVPVEQFGRAMLRGMGWTEPEKGIKKTITDPVFVRPKGMGLGADKAIKANPLLVQPEKNEKLEIKKNAYVRILGGKHKDLYGQIIGFDEYASRIIVRMAIGSTNETFNEFLCQPIPKKEFEQYGKCINNVKYQIYKSMENEHGQIEIKKEAKKLKSERNGEKEQRSHHTNRYQMQLPHKYVSDRSHIKEEKQHINQSGKSVNTESDRRRQHSRPRESHRLQNRGSSSECERSQRQKKSNKSKKNKKSKSHSKHKSTRRRSDDTASSSSSDEKYSHRNTSGKHKSRR